MFTINFVSALFIFHVYFVSRRKKQTCRALIETNTSYEISHKKKQQEKEQAKQNKTIYGKPRHFEHNIEF